MSDRPRRWGLTGRRFLWGALCAFGVAIVAWLVSRPAPAPYVPGADTESNAAITRRLDRSLPTGADDAPQAGASGASPPRAGTDAASLRFVDVAEEAGILFRHFQRRRSSQLPEDMGSGLAWGDYDGDGDPDLFLANISGPLTASPDELESSPSRGALYRNDGQGRFTDVTLQVGLNADGWGMGAAWGDMDADGDLDLVVTRYGTSQLHRNDGRRFVDVSDESGVGRAPGFWTGASWADYDRDGDLDLYVCGYVDYTPDPAHRAKTTRHYQSVVPYTLNPSSYPPTRNLLFRNEGGVFREVARELGVDNPTGRSLAAAWVDVDHDRWPDLYVANDVSDNAMFWNDGQGGFKEISHPALVADHRGAMGLGVGDWDNDGDQDLFVTHWIAQENALFENQHEAIERTEAVPTRFLDFADGVGLGQIALDYIGWGCGFFDYDNDGRLDLYVINGSTFQEESDPSRLKPMRNLLFWNGGKGKGFFEVGERAGGEAWTRPRVGRGAAAADYDGDGDQDLVVVVHGGAPLLLRNDGGDAGAWLHVRLKGETRRVHGAWRSTTFAAGTIVQARVGTHTYTRVVGSGASYLSHSPPGEAHFGLGNAAQVDELIVRWPSGHEQRLVDLPVRTTMTIAEGETRVADGDVR